MCPLGSCVEPSFSSASPLFQNPEPSRFAGQADRDSVFTLYFGGCTPLLQRRAERMESASDPRFYFGCSSYRSTPRHCYLTVLSGSRTKAMPYVRWANGIPSQPVAVVVQ
jgi:hypothetical protein